MTLDALVDLRFDSLSRVPQFVGGKPARDAIRARIAETLEAAVEAGAARHLIAGGRALASVVHWRDPDAWYGVPTRYVAVDYRPEALGWTLDTLHAERALFGDDVDFNLFAHQWPVARRLLDWGFGVDVVVLFGEPRPALERLMAGPAPVDPAQLGLRVERWTDGPWTQQMIALRSRVFTDEPEYCWFGASPGSLEHFLAALRGGDEQYWLLIRDDALLGYFGTGVRDDPYWGRTGGMDLVLSAALRGRGLARYAYRVILETLVQEKARVFKGGTCQKPVLALARQMGRPLCSVVIRRRTAFPVSHFAGYLPPSFAVSQGI